ncbi:MAG: SPFH domain-containing protein [Firmicutes bacterium]|nr:SPFH domain-containing protein [Bacillota bacterium]
MGLIRAVTGSVRGVMADQWKDFFFCEAMPPEVLMRRGVRNTTDRGTKNKGAENIIVNGSRIAVAEGQAMAIVEQGKIVEFSAEPGQFTWDSSTEPSIFSGGLGNLFKVPANMISRVGFGGHAAKDQRIYFFNLLEIKGNKYGTPQPVPFRVVDNNIGLDIDITIRCNGMYSYRMINPLLFFRSVAGNVTTEYRRESLDPMLRTELLTALQPAFAKISAMGIRYSVLPAHTTEISKALNEVLDEKWAQTRGIAIASFGVNTVSASPEDEKLIRDWQLKGMMAKNPSMAGAMMAKSQARAMENAASNQGAGGAMMGFMNMNAAMNAGGMNANQLFGMGQQQPQPMQQQQGGWQCACGMSNQARFCGGCGKPQPQPQSAGGWQCACGSNNQGKFCGGCGKGQPSSDKWACACGAKNAGGFCGSCGKAKS